LDYLAGCIIVKKVCWSNRREKIVYTYDKAKIFSIPLMDHVVVFSTESSANAENIVEKALEYINTNGTKLSLYPPSNIIFNYSLITVI